MSESLHFSFPAQLSRIRENIEKQEAVLRQVAGIYADALSSGGLIYLYANGHSMMSVAESVIRMGALTGFKAVLQTGLTSFTDVLGPNGIRVCQGIERVEGIAANLLKEMEVGPKDVLVVITATGTTPAAVDMALEFSRKHPDNALVGIACRAQSKNAPPKHSAGQNLWHVLESAKRGVFIDNGMPEGDLSVSVNGQAGSYQLCPLSSIGAFSVVQSLNELTVRELDSRGIRHPVLQNMHIGNTEDNYDAWLLDQRKRYARSIYNPDVVRDGLANNEE